MNYRDETVMTLRDLLKLYYQHNSQGEMSQGGTSTSALTESTVGPACEVCGFVIMTAPDTAAVAPLCLGPACVPAAFCMLYVCLYNEPILEWAGQKNPCFMWLTP